MKKTLSLLFGLILICAALPLWPASASAEDIQLEGVVQGLGKNPNALSALVNGEPLQEGDEVEGYVLMKIEEHSIHLKNKESGAEKDLAIGEMISSKLPQTAAEPSGPAEKSWFEKAIDKHLPQLGQLKESAQYAGVVKDMRVIYTAVQMEYINNPNPDNINPSIRRLALEGKIPKFFKNGTNGGYKFSVKNADYKLRVSADPIEDKSLNHFLIDEMNYIYAEEGRPATQESPRFQNGFNLTVTPDP